MARLLARTLPESIQIDLSLGSGEYLVNADPTRLQQVIMNLAINARDAMLPGSAGRIAIELSRTKTGDRISCVTCGPVFEEEWVAITVQDDGIGINADILPYIFEPFFTTKEVGRGTGLGLAQVHGILKQHGGHIQVSSQPGFGTKFMLYLPAFDNHPPQLAHSESDTYTYGDGETILVVEDDKTVRNALIETLELLNYRVLEAPNGQIALELLEKHSEIALVLSDLVMPVMGGQMLLTIMRRLDIHLPVVMLSGHPMEAKLKDLEAQGLSGWLLKPPRLEQLAHTLAQALNSKV